jgi:small subunit ribosomal protein S7
MLNGKKQLAERLVYDGMQKAAARLKVENPLEVFETAMKNIQPHVETRSRRVGGANYQIPFEVRGQRQNHLTTMWFVAACRSRKGISMADRWQTRNIQLERLETSELSRTSMPVRPPRPKVFCTVLV